MATLKRRPDGRFVKTITDPRTGKRLYFYGMTEREINRKVLEYSAAAARGRTFAEVAAEWWDEAEPRLAEQSKKVYRPAMRRALEAFGDTLIKDINPKKIILFLKSLSAKGLADKTVSNGRLICNMIFNHAVLHGDIEVNPCTAVISPKTGKKTKRGAADTTDEQIVKQNTEMWLLPFFALYTGMRKGEMLALQWKDIDFDKNLIRVTKSVYHQGDCPLIKTPKTEAGIRTVPLLAPLKNELTKLAATAPIRTDPDAYIFSDTGDKPLTNRRYITIWSHYVEATGIKCTAHQLRHSFATIAFECGVPVKSVQEILGHRQLATTMDLYTDFRQKALTDAAEILNQKLK